MRNTEGYVVKRHRNSSKEWFCCTFHTHTHVHCICTDAHVDTFTHSHPHTLRLFRQDSRSTCSLLHKLIIFSRCDKHVRPSVRSSANPFVHAYTRAYIRGGVMRPLVLPPGFRILFSLISSRSDQEMVRNAHRAYTALSSSSCV